MLELPDRYRCLVDAPPPSVPTASAQQLRLPAEPLQSARCALTCALDALQALLAALADRDQLGLDLPAALDGETDRVCLRASGHDSVCLSCSVGRKSERRGWSQGKSCTPRQPAFNRGAAKSRKARNFRGNSP